MLQDQEILKMVDIGDQQGMKALFNRYYKPLVVFAEAYIHDLQEAEDLVQEQLVKLWTRKAFTDIAAGALSTFLFTVIKNACLNWAEKKRLPLISLELPHLQIAWEEAERMDDSREKLVIQAVKQLPERTQQVVELVMLKELTYKETATALGISVNTVKTLLKAGVKELRTMLKDKQNYLFFWYMQIRFKNEAH